MNWAVSKKWLKFESVPFMSVWKPPSAPKLAQRVCGRVLLTPQFFIKFSKKISISPATVVPLKQVKGKKGNGQNDDHRQVNEAAGDPCGLRRGQNPSEVVRRREGG